MVTLTPAQILALPLHPGSDFDHAIRDRNLPRTVRGALVGLLLELWEEEDGFSGKRPFGNSQWQCDLHMPLIDAGVIHGGYDEDGYLDHCDCRAAAAEIAAAIMALTVPADA